MTGSTEGTRQGQELGQATLRSPGRCHGLTMY